MTGGGGGSGGKTDAVMGMRVVGGAGGNDAVRVVRVVGRGLGVRGAVRG